MTKAHSHEFFQTTDPKRLACGICGFASSRDAIDRACIATYYGPVEPTVVWNYRRNSLLQDRAAYKARHIDQLTGEQ